MKKTNQESEYCQPVMLGEMSETCIHSTNMADVNNDSGIGDDDGYLSLTSLTMCCLLQILTHKLNDNPLI